MAPGVREAAQAVAAPSNTQAYGHSITLPAATANPNAAAKSKVAPTSAIVSARRSVLALIGRNQLNHTLHALNPFKAPSPAKSATTFEARKQAQEAGVKAQDKRRGTSLLHEIDKTTVITADHFVELSAQFRVQVSELR